MKKTLADLKIGDVVIVSNTYPGSISKLSRVENITPTGRIRVNGSLFTKGIHRVDNWHAYYITPATEEDIDRVRKDNRKAAIQLALHRFDWNNVTYEQTIAINDILGLVPEFMTKTKTDNI